jgi:hypothetical protein
MAEIMTSPIVDDVFLVRDRESRRHIVGVYRSRANAVAAIWDITNDVSTGPEGSEDWDLCYEQYEIVEMPLD